MTDDSIILGAVLAVVVAGMVLAAIDLPRLICGDCVAVTAKRGIGTSMVED